MTEAVPGRHGSFAPVRIPKASELLAQQLRRAILIGDLPEGTLLPPEKRLVIEFGVSRATLREGLRLLEADGLIVTRPGRGGGATVCRPSRSTHTRSLALLLQFQGTTLSHLLEARRAIKPGYARLAAERITPQELAELRAIVDELPHLAGDPEAYLAASTRFHVVVAQATRNPVLHIYSTSLTDLIYDQMRTVPFTRDDLTAGAAAHRRVFEALERGDGEATERRLARHLAAVQEVVARRAGQSDGPAIQHGGPATLSIVMGPVPSVKSALETAREKPLERERAKAAAEVT